MFNLNYKCHENRLVFIIFVKLRWIHTSLIKNKNKTCILLNTINKLYHEIITVLKILFCFSDHYETYSDF